jgi:hypothetical protein
MGRPVTEASTVADLVEREMRAYAEIARFQQQLRITDAERLARDLRHAVDAVQADTLRAVALQLDLQRSVAESNGWAHHRIVLYAIAAQASPMYHNNP